MRYIYTLLLLPLGILTPLFVTHLFYTCPHPIKIAIIAVTGVYISYELFAKKIMTKGRLIKFIFVSLAVLVGLLQLTLSTINSSRETPVWISAKQSMSNISIQAELYYNSNNFSYTGLCSESETRALLDRVSDKANQAQIPHCRGIILDWLHSKERIGFSKYTCSDSDEYYEVQQFVPAFGVTWIINSTGLKEFPSYR